MRLVMKWASRGSFPFMKMLYPRKMEDVLWHSATCLFSKSIFVKIPRLPTIRVIGSQFISTKLRFLLELSVPGCSVVAMKIFLSSVGMGSVACVQVGTGMSPLRFLVDCGVRDASKRTD